MRVPPSKYPEHLLIDSIVILVPLLCPGDINRDFRAVVSVSAKAVNFPALHPELL